MLIIPLTEILVYTTASNRLW